MAFANNTVWEVRTTGSDTNGGAFNASSTGTDYSQQNTAQVAYTDLVIGATTTQLTSALHPFTSAHVGNMVNIVSGTGFTVQRVQIVSVSGVIATCDKSCGTAASIGGTGNLGGCCASVGVVTAIAAARNTIWVKSGTYTITATINMIGNFYCAAYGTTRGDGGMATITTATNSTPMFNPTSGISGLSFMNFIMTNTATVRSLGFEGPSFAMGLMLMNCQMSGFTTAISGATFPMFAAYKCSFTNCTGVAINAGSSLTSCVMNSCVVTGNGGSGLVLSSTSGGYHISNCIISNNAGSGIDMSGAPNGGPTVITNCTIANNTASGIRFSANWPPTSGISNMFLSLGSCIIYGNGAFGVTAPSNQPAQLYSQNNAIGSNTSGNYNNCQSFNDVTLTANPFTNATTRDYSLNSTSGGGAACKGTGYPGIFPLGLTTGLIDVGAVQSSGSGSSVQNYGYTG